MVGVETSVVTHVGGELHGITFAQIGPQKAETQAAEREGEVGRNHTRRIAGFSPAVKARGYGP